MVWSFWIIKTLLLTMFITSAHAEMMQPPLPGPEAGAVPDEAFFQDLFKDVNWDELIKEVEQEMKQEEEREKTLGKEIPAADALAAKPFAPSFDISDFKLPEPSTPKVTISTEGEPTFKDPESLFLSPSTITTKEKGKPDITSPTDAAFEAFVFISNEIIDAICAIEQRMMGASIDLLVREQYISNQQPLADKLEIALELLKSKKVYTRVLLTPPASNKKLVDDMTQLRKDIVASMHSLQECVAKLPEIRDEEKSEEGKEDVLRALAAGKKMETVEEENKEIDTIAPEKIVSKIVPVKGLPVALSPIERALNATFKKLTTTIDNVSKMIIAADVTKAFEERRKDREKKTQEFEQRRKSRAAAGGYGAGRGGWGGGAGGYGGGGARGYGGGGFGGAGGYGGYGAGGYGGGSRWGGAGPYENLKKAEEPETVKPSEKGPEEKKDGGRGGVGQREEEKDLEKRFQEAIRAAKAATEFIQKMRSKLDASFFSGLSTRLDRYTSAIDAVEGIDEDKSKKSEQKSKNAELTDQKNKLKGAMTGVFHDALLAGTDEKQPIDATKVLGRFEQFVGKDTFRGAVEARAVELLAAWGSKHDASELRKAEREDQAAAVTRAPAAPAAPAETDVDIKIKLDIPEVVDLKALQTALEDELGVTIKSLTTINASEYTFKVDRDDKDAAMSINGQTVPVGGTGRKFTAKQTAAKAVDVNFKISLAGVNRAQLKTELEKLGVTPTSLKMGGGANEYTFKVYCDDGGTAVEGMIKGKFVNGNAINVITKSATPPAPTTRGVGAAPAKAGNTKLKQVYVDRMTDLVKLKKMLPATSQKIEDKIDEIDKQIAGL